MTGVGARDTHWKLSAPVTSSTPPCYGGSPWAALLLTEFRHPAWSGVMADHRHE